MFTMSLVTPIIATITASGKKQTHDKMPKSFPEIIKELPEADIPIEGVKASISQADSHQILFMEFDNDIEVPEHSHGAQWGVVIEGEIELIVDGKKEKYKKGDSYSIPLLTRTNRNPKGLSSRLQRKQNKERFAFVVSLREIFRRATALLALGAKTPL